MSMGLAKRERTRSRSSLGRSRRRAGGGASGEGAAVVAEAARRRERRRGGVDIAKKRNFQPKKFLFSCQGRHRVLFIYVFKATRHRNTHRESP